MTQVLTIVQADGAGSAVRTGFNAIIEAIASMNIGPSAPNDNSTRAGSFWWDTTTNIIKIRNAADTAFINFADVLTGPDRLRLYSENVNVLTQGANTFTATQIIDVTGAVGEYILRSTLAAGVPSRLTFSGHDGAGNDHNYGQIRSNITANTNGAEAGELILSNSVAGSLTDRITANATGGILTGIWNFGTGSQINGTAIQTLIDNAVATISTASFSGPLTLAQADSGKQKVFTGSSPQNVTCPELTDGSFVVFHNNGTATLTFVVSGTSFQNGVTLAAGKTCTLWWMPTTTAIRITGENT